MEYALSQLGYSATASACFLKKGGTYKTVLGWTAETCPTKEIWTRLGRCRGEFVRMHRAEPLLPWAKKWKADRFIKEAGPSELLLTTARNPFYPLLAFGVSYEACVDLGIPSTPECRIYALVLDRVRKGLGDKSSVDAEIGRMGLPSVDPLSIRPLTLPDSHALKDVDVRTTSASEMKSRDCVYSIREKTACLNELGVENGSYVKKRDVTFLAQCIHDMVTVSST